jgi:hypothetical protein
LHCTSSSHRLEKSEGRSDIYPMVPVVQFSVALGDKRVGLEMSLKEEVWDIRLGERYRVASTLPSKLQ